MNEYVYFSQKVIHDQNKKQKFTRTMPLQLQLQQDAQLSQRDRAAGCVIVFDKSGILELGDNILRTL